MPGISQDAPLGWSTRRYKDTKGYPGHPSRVGAHGNPKMPSILGYPGCPRWSTWGSPDTEIPGTSLDVPRVGAHGNLNIPDTRDIPGCPTGWEHTKYLRMPGIAHGVLQRGSTRESQNTKYPRILDIPQGGSTYKYARIPGMTYQV